MFETAGSLTIVQPVLTLVGLVALPLIWALLAAAFARAKSGAVRGTSFAYEREGIIAPIVSITCALGTLGLALVFATRLALLPRGYVLVQHVAQLGRLGQLDLAFDLALEPRSATFAILVAIVAAASALQTSWSPRPGAGARLAWTGLVTTGTMLLCVGDGFAPVLVGLGLLSIGTWGLSFGGPTAPNIATLAGNVAVLLGFVFLFWSLGGAFGPSGYDADGAPRFVLVTTGASSEQPDKAMLVMTTHAGALVSSDDADLPGEPVASPLSILVPPGIYTLRVQGGVASGDVVVPRVALSAGRVHVLTPYGPTASLRALDDQLAVPRLAPTNGIASVRGALAGRTISGLRASAIILLLVVGGALAHAHALGSRRGPSALGSVLEAIPAPYLALRFAPLVDPLGADGVLVVVLGAASAVVLAARASSVDDAQKALRGALASASAVALTAAGLGEPSAAIVIACSVVVATSAALAAIEARRDVRWLGVACSAAVGLLPGAGVSWGYILAVSAALGSATTGSVGWAVFAAAIAAAILIANALGALGAFRVYDAVIRVSVREPGRSRAQGAIVIVLAVVALVAGIALGAGTSPFGGHVVPLARRLTGAAATATAPKAVATSALLLTIVAATSGVILARRVSSLSSPPGWLLSLGRPYSVLAWAAGELGHGVRFLARSVRAMDRDVIEDVPAAIRDAVLRAKDILARTGRRTAQDPVAGAVAIETDAPQFSERSRTILVLAMVALLGLVVLSSIILG